VYWSLSAWQNLLYFGRLKGLRAAEIKPRAERLLRELGLWERRNDSVGGFSRGMQQKVAIAAALVTDPAIVLLDEPTIGLDVEAARTVREWVVRLAHDEGKAIVLTTHQLAMAEELSDQVAVIREGHIITDLPTHELLERYVEDRFEVTVDTVAAHALNAPPAGTTLGTSNGQPTIQLSTDDQDALYDVLAQLRHRNVPVIGVSRVQPSLEEVFVSLVRGE
jgi:ABC-2 type transport system ATP-binding protein